MQLHLSLHLPDEASHIPMLRRISRDALLSSKVAPHDVDDLELLIGELATNAVRHARAPSFRVDVELYEGIAVVTVTDAGTGFHRRRVPPPGTERYGDGMDADGFDGGRFGGWGLPLVETLAETVEYLPGNPHGTVVRAKRRIAMA